MTGRPDEGASQPSDAARHGIEHEFAFVPRFVATPAGTRHNTIREAIAALASVSLDFDALNGFLRCGLFFNGATPFRDVRRVHSPPVIVNAAPLPREHAIDAYIDLFRQAVGRRRVPNSALALSGGCDSRHILLELHRQRALPDYSLTSMLRGRPAEVEIAAELARRTGVRHVVRVAEPENAVIDERWKNDACGFMSVEHGWFAGVGRDRDALPWWDGIGGDVLSAGLFLEDWNLALFRENRLDELADRLVAAGRVPYFSDQSLFPRADVLAKVRAELAIHHAAPNPVGSFYFWNRTRVSIAASAFGLLRPRQQVVLAPYLDRDLWAFLASQPAELYLSHEFHRDAVRRAYPEFAELPYYAAGVWRDRPADRRTKAWRLVRYLMDGAIDREALGMALRTVRAAIDPRRAIDIEWLLPLAVFCVEARRIAAGVR